MIRKLVRAWLSFWRRCEGPELEPFLWHSHYLSAWAATPHLKEFGRKLTGRVIDIGAGTGHGAAYLDARHAEYFPTDLPSGRDPSDTSITRRPRLDIFHCSVYDLPFNESHFGGAMMLSVLEHLEQPARGLSEIFRVLKPGGQLLISVPFAFPLHGAPWDFRRWTAIGLTKELEQAGFVVDRSINCGGALAALTLNFHFLLRFHLANSSNLAIRLLLVLLTPLLLPLQLVLNAVAVLADRLDKSGAFPICIAVLARKPAPDEVVKTATQEAR